MASVKFFIKSDSYPSTIYLRFLHGRKFDFTKSTSLIINSKYWNNKNGNVRQVAEFSEKLNLQNKLNELRDEVINKFSIDYAKGELINSYWLESIIKNVFNQRETTDLNYFVSYSSFYIDNLDFKVQKNGRTGVTHITKLRYKNLTQKIKDFQNHKNKQFVFTDIDLKFYREFVNFLNKNQKLSFNTIGKHIALLKSICKDAKENGIKVNNDFTKSEFRVTKETSTFVTLSEKEIDTIFYANFEQNYLQNAKNWLIIGVWTGARASDLVNFTKENLNGDFIEYTAQKTGQKIILPVHWQIKSIIENIGGFPHKISTQKYNDYIKEVCKELNINDEVKGRKLENIGTQKNPIWRKVNSTYKKYELVSTHIGRRTFATIHYGKLPTPVIMSATGHTTEKMLLKYIGKTAKDNADFLREYWRTEKLKKDNKIELKIAK